MAAEPEARLRDARPREAGVLSALALRSKGYWGYAPAFLDACRDELTYTPARISDGDYRFVVAESGGQMAGFYALAMQDGSRFELEALFVDPEFIGKGIGRALIKHALEAVAAAGGRTLLIQGDPNAEPFYRAAGGRKTGVRESASIPGRDLPLFEITIEPSP